MKILMTGSTGLVGTAVREANSDLQWIFLVRDPAKANGRDLFAWNPDGHQIDVKSLDGIDAVVHLAGESIAAGRWTQSRKKKIRDSRVEGTRFLVERLLALPAPPKVFISASAIGYYGNRGDNVMTEESAGGGDFLASVCQEWEDASKSLLAKGVRVVHARFGIILSPQGGALAKMLPPFKMGVGGKLGSGTQFMSWVMLEDVVRVIRFSLENSAVAGPVNVVAPSPVTNQEFTKTLGRVLHRPTILPAPAFALKLLLGEMAEALLLSSARVKPNKLLEAGFKFKHPTFEAALLRILN